MSDTVHKNAADSYGVVAKQQAATGTKSDVLLTPFRNYNNYVKKSIIQRSMGALVENMGTVVLNGANDQRLVSRLLMGFLQSGTNSVNEVVDGFSVLDIASGRGGDLQKWLYGQYPDVATVAAANKNKKTPEQIIPPFVAKDDGNGGENPMMRNWSSNIPKDAPVFVSNVASVDISAGAVEVALERYKQTATVDVVPGTAIHDSMVKDLRGGRELPSAQFFVSNCLSPAFWSCAQNNNDTTTPVEYSGTFSTKVPTLQTAPHPCTSVGEVRQASLKFRAGGERQSHAQIPVDIISVQFAFHYACETMASMQANLTGMLATLVAGKPKSNSLPRGVLVLTTVDASAITAKLREAYRTQMSSQSNVSSASADVDGSSPTSVTYKSKLFSLELPIVSAEIRRVLEAFPLPSKKGDNEAPLAVLPLGTRYHFKLEGHVDCDEYAVPYDDLIRAATTGCNLHLDNPSTEDESSPLNFALLESHSFVDQKAYLHTFNSTPKYKRQMNGKSLDEGDLDLIGIYRTYIFVAH